MSTPVSARGFSSHSLIVDSELRLRMERLGQKRATYFTWQKTAQRTLAIYQEVAERGRPAGKTMPSASITPR